MFNVWKPGNEYFDFNDGVSSSLGYEEQRVGGQILCQSFVIPNAQAGLGVAFDQVDPPFAITKPPKVAYSSTSEMTFVIKDSAGWLWASRCPRQSTVEERGWAWDQFVLHSVQENTGTPPSVPAPGFIQSFQFSGGEGVHGEDNNIPQTIRLAYIAGRTPSVASSGSIRKVVLTDRNPEAHDWLIGTVDLVDGARRPIKYLGALPFGLQMNGPRNRLAVLPYRGPIVAGYQSGTPWVTLKDNTSLAGMLDFMLDAQVEFTRRNPQRIVGPWMHIYLQALWDTEQNGPIDTWVWDGPDGNPAWNGWQYRAFDSMGRTWYEASKAESGINNTNMTKLRTVNTKFLDWLHGWLTLNPNAMGVPNDWRPPGWTQGTPFPPNSYLDPKFTAPSAHDLGLALKGAVFCALAGYDVVKAKYVIHRLIKALLPIQVPITNTNEMQGAFTKNPDGYEVYGFEQGEILEALALCKQHPHLLSKK